MILNMMAAWVVSFSICRIEVALRDVAWCTCYVNAGGRQLAHCPMKRTTVHMYF